MPHYFLTDFPAFAQLQQLAAELPHLSELFQAEPDRGQSFTAQAEGLQLDYSKQRVNRTVVQALCRLYTEADVPQALQQLFRGDRLNVSEDRPALHTRLRVPADQQTSEFICVEQALQQMAHQVEQVHQGIWRGFSGKQITDVVNLGVGGSDLGPLMVQYALKEYASSCARHLKVHFASTIDGSQLFDLLDRLNPETTLFLVVSKSFTTVDTLSNANTVRSWLQQHCPDTSLMLRCHFIGISAAPEKMSQWGLPERNQLRFWDWVGGRFSLWSSVGCAIAMALGMPVFRELLAGAHSMDQHVISASPEANIPALLALLGIWNVNIQDIRAHAILPYDGRLRYFPGYLEQLEMESNGKSVNQQGQPLTYATCPVLWGEIGANAQHAFYQLLHQGTQAVAADFILAARRYRHSDAQPHHEALVAQHELNIANCLAQSRVLALGNHAVAADDNPYRHYPGNQPSSTLLLDELTPFTLGSLIACYEHKVFIQAVLWGINPFDQWGVELGKTVARELQPLLGTAQASADACSTDLDSSTLALARQIQALRQHNPQKKQDLS